LSNETLKGFQINFQKSGEPVRDHKEIVCDHESFESFPKEGEFRIRSNNKIGVSKERGFGSWECFTLEVISSLSKKKLFSRWTMQKVPTITDNS